MPKLKNVRGGLNTQSTTQIDCRGIRSQHDSGIIQGTYTCITTDDAKSGVGPQPAPLPAARHQALRLRAPLSHTASARPLLVGQFWDAFCKYSCKSLGRGRFSSVSVTCRSNCPVLVFFLFATHHAKRSRSSKCGPFSVLFAFL